MSEKKPLETPYSVKSIWPAFIPLVLAVVIFAVAQGYSEISRRFPTMVSVTLAVLAIIDIYSRTNLPGKTFINSFWGSGFDRREMSHNPGLRDELAMLGWLAFAFAAMAFVGILVAVPLFIFLFVWLQAKRTYVQAVITASVIFAFEFTVFEWLLNYDLYRGLIFNGEGFSAW